MAHNEKQKLKEIACAERFAAHLNETLGTDYSVTVKDVQEPADVLLVSTKGHKALRVQVVTAPAVTPESPTNYEHRNDNDAVRKTSRKVSELLATSGCAGLHVTLHPHSKLLRQALPLNLANRLASLVANQVPTMKPGEVRTIDGVELYLSFKEEGLAEYVAAISLFLEADGHEPPVVTLSDAAFLHDSAVDLEGAIRLKSSEKYGSSAKGHVLLVYGHWTVTDAQVDALRGSSVLDSLEFDEVWVSGTFCQTVRVK